jgi:hypothetical protein
LWEKNLLLLGEIYKALVILSKKGLYIWRVGNRKTIRIWKHRWLNSPTTFRVLSPPREIDPFSTVSIVIDDDMPTRIGGTLYYWNNYSREKRYYQSTPVSATDQEDTLIWRGTAKRVFSVRSAYHIVKEQEMETKVEGSSCARNNTIWSIIWHLNITNVGKHFQSACHDILPTRANLCVRKVIMDPLCPTCKREPEMAFHTLWQCPSAGDVWIAGGFIFRKSCFEGPDFLQATGS